MLYHRDLFDKISKVLQQEEYILLTGARQVGKTSLLLMLKEFLEQRNERCYYLNLENPDYLNALNQHPFNVFDLIPAQKSKCFVCIDEVQYLSNPTNILKLLYDEKRDAIKIIASGSSAFYLDTKFIDSLVRRKRLFELFPLSFDEFLLFNEQHDLIEQKEKNSMIFIGNNCSLSGNNFAFLAAIQRWCWLTLMKHGVLCWRI